MLNSVSWQQYLVILLIVMVAYYLVIWVFVFHAATPSVKRAGRLFSHKRYAEDQPDEMMSTTQHIIDELRPLFTKDINRQQLFTALRATLKKYNGWREPGFRAMITEYIITECEVKCSIHPSEEEIGALWLG